MAEAQWVSANGETAAPRLRRVRVLVAMVLAVSVTAMAAVVVLQTQERDARAKEAVARVYASSLRQSITDLVPVGDAPAAAPSPVLAGLIRGAAQRSIAQLETIRPLDPTRTEEIARLVVGIRMAGIAGSQAARQRGLADVMRASRIADQIATHEHQLAERAELRSLIGSGAALAFAVLAVFMLVFRERRHSLADADAHTAVVRRLAEHDSLTDLPNRRRFDADLDKLASETGTVEIAVCDLNEFKEINDRLGHDAGDAVLITIGRDLQATIGTVGTVYRTGGDEFCVISQPGLRVAGLARGALEREGTTPVGSVGAASFPTDHAVAREVVRLADRRMYAAKRAITHVVAGPDAA